MTLTDLQRRDRGRHRRVYDSRKAAGLCTECGRTSDLETEVMCGPCSERLRVNAAARYERRKALGLCYDCGDDAQGNGVRCPSCAAAHNERQKLYAKRRRKAA